jgi:hypothetical protein
MKKRWKKALIGLSIGVVWTGVATSLSSILSSTSRSADPLLDLPILIPIFFPSVLLALVTFPLLLIFTPRIIVLYLFLGAPIVFFVVGYVLGRREENKEPDSEDEERLNKRILRPEDIVETRDGEYVVDDKTFSTRWDALGHIEFMNRCGK